MALLTLRDIHHSFGGPALLDGVDLAIESRERVGLVGRNGAGKSTLMKIVAGELRADEGDIDGMPGLRIAALRQDLPAAQGGTIFDV
ncbi:MAG: ABC-F family ATP-binding cassette domain-containing protein, partial [Bosea sp.]|uniref:ATP-binding cassette domain-containing protein n=1 Tax=Bosea sp. (in: a-proteobacteria) TaxID=1871050 RepID=UPI0023A2D8CC|nr:ABC-F family ATP-binding cassette domain-containing protein [Bosea sp. (in: a-proteobacteria)]